MKSKDCIFCHIATGETQASIIYQDDQVVAFLDKHPIRPGHTLIVPRDHVAYYEDLPETVAARIMHVGQRLGRAMKALENVPQVCFLYAGTDIPHVHAHVYPMHNKHDVTSRQYIEEKELTFRITPTASAEELSRVAEQLRTTLINPQT